MGARHYAPSLGDFISPDPVIPDTFRPLAANRYAYAYNNPMSYVDPPGLDPFGIGIEGHFVPPNGGLPDMGGIHGLAGVAQPPPAITGSPASPLLPRAPP